MKASKAESAMPEVSSPRGSNSGHHIAHKTHIDDDDFQAAMLQGVSRTFALTIPQLPVALCRVVANAYLLCRIVDTIEDESALSAAQKNYFSHQFLKALGEEKNAERFAAQLGALLSPQTIPAEHELIRNAPRVVRITRGFSEPQRQALQRCVSTMAEGMGQFQLRGNTQGLQSLEEMNLYCYYVAGVVGQMLTSLFCLYSPEIARRHDALTALAVSFGQGLQMTNILKDVWEDYARGACWLPGEIFAEEGFELSELTTARNRKGFERGIRRLVGVAHEHLRNALAYTLLIPKKEAGIRNFCLWAVGMALLTLRKINGRLSYTSEKQVRISRLSVKTIVVASRVAAKHDAVLKLLFNLAAWRLPRGPSPVPWLSPSTGQNKVETGT